MTVKARRWGQRVVAGIRELLSGVILRWLCASILYMAASYCNLGFYGMSGRSNVALFDGFDVSLH